MPINPALALQVKGFELPDPMAQMAQVTQIQNALQQQRMGDIQMQNALREQQRKQGLEKIMSGFAPDAKIEDVAPALQRGGYFVEAQTLIKSRAELENQRRQAKEAEYKGMISEADIFGRVMGVLKKDSTQEDYNFALNRLKNILKPEDVAQLGETFDYNRVRQFVDMTMSHRDRLEAALKERTTVATETKAQAAASQAATAAAKLPFEQRRAEAAERLADQGRRTEIEKLQAARDALPPGSPARVEIENKIDALGRGAAPTLTEVIDPDDPKRMLRVDARTYTGGGVGSPGVIGISGKEPSAAKRASVEDEGREQFRSIIDDLRANFDRLKEMRAITSTERGPISNVATALETTGVGQVASRAVGGKAQAIRDEISSSRSMLLSALKKVTGKSASELNSNVELRTFLDSISDPAKSYESAINILDNMENTYLRGGETSAGQRSATRRGEAPSGGTFSVTAPDGKTYTFPTQNAADQFRNRMGGR